MRGIQVRISHSSQQELGAVMPEIRWVIDLREC